LGWRFSGPIDDANYFAGLLVFVVPLAVEPLLHERHNVMRMGAAWALFVSLLCIYFTASRGALVALAIVIVTAAAVYRERRLYLVLAGVSLVVVIIAAFPVAYLARVESMLAVVPGLDTGTPADGSVRGRLDMWRIALALFVDHPLLGIGLGNYEMHYQEYARLLGLTPQQGDLGAHNIYLEVAAERGLVGLAAFVALLVLAGVGQVQTAWRLQRAGRADDAALVWAFGAGLLGFLATRLFLHDDYGQFLWLALTLALAIPQLAAHDRKRASLRGGPAKQARARRRDARTERPTSDPQPIPAAGLRFGEHPPRLSSLGEAPRDALPAPSGGGPGLASAANPNRGSAAPGEFPARGTGPTVC
jgi:putative inorganic carbon (HCO3(-)) transporter